MDSELRDRTTCHRAEASNPADPAGRGRATAALISVCLAVLGSLLGHAPSLRVPLLVATAGYLVAIALAWTTLRAR
jgi:hypothetical protein